MDSMICFQDQQDKTRGKLGLREAVKNYLAYFFRLGGSLPPSLLPGCISFIFLIVDLLWNRADKYKDPNEPNKSAE